MSEVKLRPRESVDSALRRLRDKLRSEGVWADSMRHQYHSSPSQKRRAKAERARRRGASRRGNER